MAQCPRCTMALPDVARYCSRCGSPLHPHATIYRPTPPAPILPAPPPPIRRKGGWGCGCLVLVLIAVLILLFMAFTSRSISRPRPAEYYRYQRVGRIYEYDRGNPSWPEKVDGFADAMKTWGNRVSVAINKFCFIDPGVGLKYYGGDYHRGRRGHGGDGADS